jgi:phosphohistidine swiveling domain-containing protein
MIQLIGSVALNMAKAQVLKQVLNVAENTIEGVRGGLSSRSGEALVAESYIADQVSQRLLIYTRSPSILQENARQAAGSVEKLGSMTSAAAIIKSLSITTSVSGVALALSTAFVKDHKAITKSIAPGFDNTLTRIFDGIAEQFKVIPTVSDLFKTNRLVSGFKTGNVDAVMTAVSAVLPSNVLNNSELILDKNARVERKFGTQQSSSPAAPKPSQSR